MDICLFDPNSGQWDLVNYYCLYHGISGNWSVGTWYVNSDKKHAMKIQDVVNIEQILLNYVNLCSL